MSKKSHLEMLAQAIISDMQIEQPIQEYHFDSIRRWRFDFAWVERKIALEVEGGIWVNGAHNRGAHFESDAEKYNAATMRGWRVFRYTGGMIESGMMENDLRKLFGIQEVK
jgi:very-short-patch-repair endonuclease